MPVCVDARTNNTVKSESKKNLKPTRYSLRKRICTKTKYYSNSRKISKLKEALESEFAPSGPPRQPETRQALALVNRIAAPPPPTELTSLAGLLSVYPDQRENQLEYSSLWKGCHSAALIKLIFGTKQDSDAEPEKVSPTPLHLACLLPKPQLMFRLISQGAQVNLVDQLGHTPLHSVVLGDISNEYINEAVQLLVQKGASLSAVDKCGDTPLLCVRSLLKKGCYSKALLLTKILLQAGSNPHHHNKENHTLLVYSLQCLDDTFELTRMLLNNGSSVWGAESTANTSAFYWLLRTIMCKRNFTNCLKTLNLLCQLMHPQPQTMKYYVLQTISRLSSSYEVHGPVSLEARSQMNAYWEQPPSLAGSCRHVLRQTMPPSCIESSIQKMSLPVAIKSFLLFEPHTL